VRRLAGLIGAAVVLVAATPPPQDVSVVVSGLRSDRGKVLACLTANPASFPDCGKEVGGRHLAVAVPVTVRAGGVVTLDFGAVPPGRYAVSLFHDENANGKLDKMVMIPREGFGFSRDAPVHFGPPSFSAAAFDVGAMPVRQAIRMRYMLGGSAGR